MSFKDHFSTQSAIYRTARPRYAPALFEWLATQAPSRTLAWDAGCGTGQASLGLAAILGPSDGAKALANAVARFVAKPGTLTVKASAKTPTGLGLADVITLGEPTEIFEKIDLEATAE